MRTLIETLKHWMLTHAPQVLQQLNPPASKTDIQAVEQATGLKLPESLKLFLSLHNGEAGEDGLALLGNGNQLLSCEAMIEQYQWGLQMEQYLNDSQCDTPHFWKDRVLKNIIAVKGPVKPLLNHPHWLPLTCMNGDVFRYLDFDPAPGGLPGQVIEADPESCAYQVLAPDFETFLKQYIVELKANHYHIDETGYLETREPATMDWGVPDWLISR